MSYGHISVRPKYKEGDAPPSGYLDWHAWAAVQTRAGLRQRRCPDCVLWKFPQEMGKRACLACED